MGLLDIFRSEEDEAAKEAEEALKAKEEQEIEATKAFQRLLDQVRTDIESCYAMKATIDEAGYQDDSDMVDAYSLIDKVAQEIEHDVYTAAAYGVERAQKMLTTERDEEFVISKKQCRRDQIDMHNTAEAAGFPILERCVDHIEDVYAFIRSKADRDAYDKRIALLNLLEVEIQSRHDGNDDIRSRFTELATRISGATQQIMGIHAMIGEGEDPIAKRKRAELGKFFEPAEF